MRTWLNRPFQFKHVLMVVLLAALALLVGAKDIITTVNQYPAVGSTVAAAASGVVEDGPGYFLKIHGYNAKATDQYLQLFDSATVPADTAVPILTLAIAAEDNFFFDLGTIGLYFQNGLAWSNSSTVATKTIGAADVYVYGLQYTCQGNC